MKPIQERDNLDKTADKDLTSILCMSAWYQGVFILLVFWLFVEIFRENKKEADYYDLRRNFILAKQTVFSFYLC